MHRFSAFWHMRLPHRLQGQKVKSQSHVAGAYCGGHLAAQLVSTVVSASDIPLRTIKLFSVLFSGVSVHAAGRDKQTFAGASPTVRSRPTLHGPRQLFLSLCSSHVQQSSIAMAITPESRFVPIPHLHLTPPLGGSRRSIAAPFGMDKLEWRGYPRVKKIRRYVYSF